MSEELFLPTLSHWQHKNTWTGSRGAANFSVTVSQEELTAEIWRGPLIRALSEVACSARFPVSEEGTEALRRWLLEQSDKMRKSRD